ncbi:MAG: vWA domain-containing protein [Planctomycetota bacterium]|jgi:Mg-chelatase subunit ChlD
MKQLTLVLILACSLVFPAAAAEKAETPKKPAERPVVEVAFVLDTTGSMSGLISAAKSKIWFIANQIVLGKPRPKVRMALVAYRDKGDEYVTKVYDLTDNIDKVYKDLMSFRAAGGGDTPENVNQALLDAVDKLSWSEQKKALKIIYLVGDCPPHNEYEDVPTYDKIAFKAINDKGIYVNTILCGNNREAQKVWKEIARRAEGKFIQIAQGGGVRDITTPHDKELAKLNAELAATAVFYGDAKERERMRAGLSDTLELPSSSAAERVAFVAKGGDGKAITGGEDSPGAADGGAEDLVDAVREKKVRLDEIDGDLLPENMREMSPEDREKYVAEMQEKRDELLKEITELSAKRAAFVRKELEKAEGAEALEGFDYTVIEALKEQAEKKGITYED